MSSKKERREYWLDKRGLGEEDVIRDEAGREYVIAVEENGTPPDYEVREVKVFLPEELSE